MRNLHLVPGFFQGVRLFHANVENIDGPAGAGQHYRAGLGNVARAARAMMVKAASKPSPGARHDRKSAQASAGGTALSSAKTEVLDYAAGPLSVEVRGVHHHGPAISPVPGGRNNAAMPEGRNDRLSLGAGLVVVLLPRFSKRSVGPRTRITAMTAEAITGICMRRQ